MGDPKILWSESLPAVVAGQALPAVAPEEAHVQFSTGLKNRIFSEGRPLQWHLYAYKSGFVFSEHNTCLELFFLHEAI